MEPEHLAENLKLALDREAAKNPPSPGGWARIELRLHREPWRRGAIAAVSIAAAAAFATLLVIQHGRPEPARPVPAQPGELLVLSQTGIPGSGVQMATGYGAAWIPGISVTYEVDQVTGRVVRKISTPGTSPAGCGSGVATGLGAVWVTYGCRGIYRIDARTGRVTASIGAPEASDSLAIADGIVWVATHDGNLLRIDPKTGTAAGAPIPVGHDVTGRSLGTPPRLERIVTGAGALWVDTSIGFVGRVDPVTGSVMSLKLGDVAAVGAGSVWVPGSVLLRDDPRTYYPASSVFVSANTSPASLSVTLWRGQAWNLTLLPDQPLYVNRINPADNSVPSTTPIPGSAAPGSDYWPASITAGPTGLWVIEVSDGMLFHLGIPDATRAPSPSHSRAVAPTLAGAGVDGAGVGGCREAAAQSARSGPVLPAARLAVYAPY
jgi:streptogramin lyase